MTTSDPLAPCHRYASLTMPRPRLGCVARRPGPSPQRCFTPAFFSMDSAHAGGDLRQAVGVDQAFLAFNAKRRVMRSGSLVRLWPRLNRATANLS